MRESVLKAFATKGFLPLKEVAHWRAPRREGFPQPWPDEVVSFLTFHERKIRIPYALVPTWAPQRVGSGDATP